jgi:hypothetical protein
VPLIRRFPATPICTNNMAIKATLAGPIPQWRTRDPTHGSIPSTWDERFATFAENGLGHVPTKATTEVVHSSPGYETIANVKTLQVDAATHLHNSSSLATV